MKSLFLAGALVGLLSACAVPQATTPSLASLQANVARLDVSGATCTAWFSADRHKWITASHCFDFKGGVGVLTLNDGSQKEVVTEKWSHDSTDGSRDFAVLDTKSETNLPGLTDCKTVYYGQELVVMGSPFKIDKMMSFGHVMKPLDDGMIIIGAEIWPGNSGGPVIDRNVGCVIGTAEEILMPNNKVPVGIKYVAPIANL